MSRRVWLVQEAGLADRVDETDPEIAESFVYRNLGYQSRHKELTRREEEKVRMDCAKIILHFIKILDEENGFIRRSRKPENAQVSDGNSKYVFTDKLDRLLEQLSGFQPVSIAGKVVEEGIRDLSMNFQRFGSNDKIAQTALVQNSISKLGKHFYAPEDLAYLSWKYRVVTDEEIERAPILDFSAGKYSMDEVIIMFAGAMDTLFEITAHDLPQRWEIEFETCNCYGLEKENRIEIQYDFRQGWISRLFCLLFNGGHIRKSNGQTMRVEGINSEFIVPGRRPGRIELKIEDLTSNDFVKIMGIGYVLALTSDRFSKRNLGRIWKLAFRRNVSIFRSYEAIFQALDATGTEIRSDYECGLPGCVSYQWVSLKQVRPSRRNR